MSRVFFLVCCLLSISFASSRCLAGGHEPSSVISADGLRLTAGFGDGRVRTLDVEPAHDADAAHQVGFAQAKMSLEADAAGALQMYPNCCTSYPVSLSLVVFKARGRIHRIDGDGLAVSGWCFRDGGQDVALRTSVLHGTTAERFLLRRVSDGRLLADYAYPGTDPDDPASEAAYDAAVRDAPAWVRCAE